MISSELDLKLRELMRVFLDENAKLNLSALRTEEACWVGNILDSIAFLDIPGISKLKDRRSKLLDLGTGGGFPLLPLAIALPQTTCIGLDSIKKKMDAVGRIIQKVGIPNASVITERSEVLGTHPKHREQYDIVTSRAVAPLNVLLEFCSPFVKVDGIIALWKSLHIDGELTESNRAQATVHCRISASHVYELPLDFGKRQILLFTKTAPLDNNVPRAIGEAKKNPL